MIRGSSTRPAHSRRRDVPKRLLVIGGGIIGLEMATVYDALGARVTVVELLDQLIPGCDPDLVKPLQKRISARYESILLKTSVTSVKALKSGLKVGFSSGESERYDRVLVAVGRKPNGHAIDAGAAGVTVDSRGFIPVDEQMRTNVAGIYAIGDIVGEPMLAHKAFHEGTVAAEVIAGENVRFDARTVPSVAYTDPEIAWMGLTETEARGDGDRLREGRLSVGGVRPGTVAGPRRWDHQAAVRARQPAPARRGHRRRGRRRADCRDRACPGDGTDTEDLALTIHPHPTLARRSGSPPSWRRGRSPT